jgi:hypothetical protein
MSEAYKDFDTRSTLNGKDRDTDAGHLGKDVAASPLPSNHGRHPWFGTSNSTTSLAMKDQLPYGPGRTDMSLPKGFDQTLNVLANAFHCEYPGCGKSFSNKSSHR